MSAPTSTTITPAMAEWAYRNRYLLLSAWIAQTIAHRRLAVFAHFSLGTGDAFILEHLEATEQASRSDLAAAQLGALPTATDPNTRRRGAL